MNQMNQGGNMRWTRWTFASLTIGAIVMAIVAVSCTQQAPPGPVEMTAAEKVARGKVISFSSGCQDCHTPGTFYGATDTTRMLSGSELGWEGPWGVTFPRNLTPDAETGIASWTEEDIITAFRTGHRPDQTQIMPPMPWPAYALMSDEDAHALAAFIKSLPPVHHKAPDKIPPGVKFNGPRLTFPPPPAWDGQNLPKPPDAAPPAGK